MLSSFKKCQETVVYLSIWKRPPHSAGLNTLLILKRRGKSYYSKLLAKIYPLLSLGISPDSVQSLERLSDKPLNVTTQLSIV